MKDPQQEIEELRAGVNCATVLEKATPPWLSRSQGKLQALPQVPRRRGRNRHRHAWRSRMVGPEQRRQGRRLPTRAAPRAEPQFRRGPKDAAALGRGSTRFHAGRARARQARPSNPGRSEMGPAPAAETLLGCLALSREPRAAYSVLTAAAQCDVIREGPRGSAWFAHRDPAGFVIHVDVRGPTYKGSLTGGCKSLFCFSHGSEARHGRLVLAEARDRRFEPGRDRAPARGHDLHSDRRRHGTGHDRRARGAPSCAEGFAARAARERCRRQSRRRSLRRSAPGDRRTDRRSVQAPAPADRGRGLERRPEGLSPWRSPS